MWTAEIRPIRINVFDGETQAFLKQQFDKSPVMSILALWTRYGAGKLGILRMKPTEDGATFDGDDYEEWEGNAISAYLHRHNLQRPLRSASSVLCSSAGDTDLTSS